MSMRFHTEHSVAAEASSQEAQNQRTAFEEQVHKLQRGLVLERIKAAGALRDYGVWSLEPLCEALRDPDVGVRAAAAESLGHLGDPRAIQPLVEALRSCFVGRSARNQLVLGALVVGVAVLVLVAYIWGFRAAGAFIIIQVVVRAVSGHFQRRRSHGKVCHAITDALSRIAERNPAPELRAVLPDLQAVAVDILQQEKETRDASRAAAERIKQLTEQLKQLPVVAEAPARDGASLPLPSSSRQADVDRLPRIHL